MNKQTKKPKIYKIQWQNIKFKLQYATKNWCQAFAMIGLISHSHSAPINIITSYKFFFLLLALFQCFSFFSKSKRTRFCFVLVASKWDLDIRTIFVKLSIKFSNKENEIYDFIFEICKWTALESSKNDNPFWIIIWVKF